MAAMALSATFTGFVATTVDAAILVEAAMAGHLPRVDDHPDGAGYNQLSRSGTVVVFGPQVRRWREGRAWTGRRALGNGFDVYRETSTVAGNQLTDADVDWEQQHRDALVLYVGSNVGLRQCKRDGLVKKTIAFMVGGERWGLMAYYSLADALAGHLPRPRSDLAILQTLQIRGLSIDFWGQPAPSARARTVVMMDDADIMGTSGNWMSWGQPQEVAPAQLAPHPVLPQPPLAPAVIQHHPVSQGNALVPPPLTPGIIQHHPFSQGYVLPPHRLPITPQVAPNLNFAFASGNNNQWFQAQDNILPAAPPTPVADPAPGNNDMLDLAPEDWMVEADRLLEEAILRGEVLAYLELVAQGIVAAPPAQVVEPAEDQPPLEERVEEGVVLEVAVEGEGGDAAWWLDNLAP